MVVGAGPRLFRVGLALLAVLMLTFLYDWRAFKNLSTQEAMDSAQVARNLAQGKGFSTSFIRPLSIFLVKRHNQPAPAAAAGPFDPARLKSEHPDLANAPLYPLVLAGLMKVLPFHYPISHGGFWTYAGRFWRYEPDFLLSLFNQLLFLGLVGSIFFLARRLFDEPVAWLSAVLLLGGELYWRFTVSGLSTILLLLIFTGLSWCLVLLEEQSRQPTWGPNGPFLLAGAIGALVGVGALTRYGFGWLILPVVTFLILFSNPQQRAVLILIALGAFAAVLGPWVARNLVVSGTPFGTAGFAIMESTPNLFPENRLERSLEPNFSTLALAPLWVKLMTNTREIVQDALPKMGGTWISAFFLVGLLVDFRNPATRRVRYFLLMCLPVLAGVQALGRTQLSEVSPEINSENFLVLLAPLVLVYGIALFYLLLDQVQLPALQVRYLVIGLFGAVACLPMVLVFLPPRPQPVVLPYMPPLIQEYAGYMKPNELMMSDIPWAVAWYGQRQCVWLTLQAMPNEKDRSRHEDFFAINDFLKPIQALYLTAESMDSKFVSQWVQAGEQSWGSFVAQSVLLKEEPVAFPLRKADARYFPFQLFLTDRERWKGM